MKTTKNNEGTPKRPEPKTGDTGYRQAEKSQTEKRPQEKPKETPAKKP